MLSTNKDKNGKEFVSTMEGNIKALYAGYFFMLLLSSCDLMTFSNFFFFKNFKSTVRLSNGLDPDQDQSSFGPDLGPSCLKWLSADDKSHC